ncbi:MAG: flagellin [Anaerolineae bacterium]|nr:flagellin [Anaerolineae bacterium]MDW8099678.1 flagellin [Anaerolineae bacterium]
MRVTQRRLIEEASQSIAGYFERLQKIQSIIASGKKLQKPEDDPLGAERALSIRSHLQALEATRRNLSLTDDWLSATEVALKGLQQVAERARVIALHAANEAAQSQEGFQVWAVEVGKLIEQAVQIGNSDHRGLYLFAGRKVTTQPFELTWTPAPQVSYRGDSGPMEHQLEGTVRIQVNVPGDHQLFQKMFATLGDLYGRLRAGDTAGLRVSIGELEEAMNTTLETLAVIGSRARQVDETISRLDALDVNLRGLLGQIEDADMAKASLDLHLEERMYRAILAASARLLGPSLFDYLG